MNFALNNSDVRNLHDDNFAQLQPGAMFDCGQGNSYICVDKNGDNLTVIELTRENTSKIITGQACDTATYHKDQLTILNLRGPTSDPNELSQLKLPDRNLPDEPLPPIVRRGRKVDP